jgi:hypothetical protein
MSESIQSKGGKARALKLSAEQRSEIASNAASTRWSGAKNHRKFTIPLSHGWAELSVPGETNEDDWNTITATIALWKKNLFANDDQQPKLGPY